MEAVLKGTFRLDKLGISAYERIPAVKESPGWVGCAKSHLSAVQLAIDRGYDFVCILEDDFLPLSNTFADDVQKAWDDLHGDFDVLMLAMTPIQLVRIQKDPIFKINQSLAMPGYIVSKRYMPKLLTIFKTALNEHKPIDMVTQLHQRGRHWYGFYPAIARQMPGFSDIVNQHVDYGYLEVEGEMLKFVG